MLPRSLVAVLLIVCFSNSHTHGQQWARDMFTVTSHDFSSVARGSKPQFRFEFENKYKEDVHVASVRSSCGCTTPSIEKQLVKSREKSAIVAALNTISFTGDKASVITVVFDKPFFAEVQLNIKGVIRSDVVVEPSELDFGRLNEGQPKELAVSISFTNRPDSTIKDVRSPFEHVAVQLGAALRKGATVTYPLTVKLKESAPIGQMQQHLTIVTGDPTGSSFSLPVRGEVVPILSLTPPSISLGKVVAGAQVQRKLLVKAPMPFSITKIDIKDPRIQCKVPEGKNTVHFLDLAFEAGTDAGQLRETVRIETDLEGRSAECLVIGEIAAATP